MKFDVLKRQIITEYMSLKKQGTTLWPMDEVIQIFYYFFREYLNSFGTSPPRLSNATVRDIVERLPYVDDNMHGEFILEPDEYPALIDGYFEQAFTNCNYSMAHFMSGQIRALRYYERIY